MVFLLYGLASYALFFVTFLYLMGFVTDLVVPKTLDEGDTPVLEAVIVDTILISLFAIQHTIMARPTFKKWFTRWVPVPIERSTFVLVATGLIALIIWQWRPIAGELWRVEAPWAVWTLHGLSLGGFALVLYASFLIDHFDLFGLRQVWLHARGLPYTHPPFQKPWLYRKVRNPLMLGFLIAFWATPHMTYGHLLFAGLTTLYVCMGIWFEERDLLSILGEPYREFRARTPMLLPRLWK